MSETPGSRQPPAHAAPAHEDHAAHPAPRGRYLLTLSIAALGVVYGDIGTSPLYALRECFHGPHAIEPTPANIMGVLSLVFWALILVISGQVPHFRPARRQPGRRRHPCPHGAGDPHQDRQQDRALAAGAARHLRRRPALRGRHDHAGHLGAQRGRGAAIPPRRSSRPTSLPITISILVALFLIQSHGTGGVGRIFGPVTFVWFATLAVLGAVQIVRNPAVLAAINPIHGLSVLHHQRLDRLFRSRHGRPGHHRRRIALRRPRTLRPPSDPHRLVHDCDAGAAAQLLRTGRAADVRTGVGANPFYLLAPGWAALSARRAGHVRNGHRVAGGDLRAPFQSRCRPCSSASCRVCGSRTHRLASSARSTSPPSTGR